MPTVDVPAPEEYQETFPASLRGRLPVLVRLRDFWQHLPTDGVRSIGIGGLELALERWLADQGYPGMDWPCLKAHLDDGSALLMLDGVDEVPPIRKADDDEWYPREMLLAGLPEAVARWTQAGNRVLVTSRPYGLNAEQQRKLGLSHAPILGLDQTLQSLLVRRWFIRLKENRDLGLETAGTMIDHMRVERGLDALAGNPLLLTAMCISVWNQAIVLGDCLQILAGRDAAIPDDLTTFFQKCVFQAVEQEIAVKDRHTLAVALGRLGDPRIELDLRLKNGLFLQDDGYSHQEFWSDEGWQWVTCPRNSSGKLPLAGRGGWSIRGVTNGKTASAIAVMPAWAAHRR